MIANFSKLITCKSDTIISTARGKCYQRLCGTCLSWACGVAKIRSSVGGEMTRAFVQVGILGYVLTFLVILIKSLNKLSLSNKSFFLCILSPFSIQTKRSAYDHFLSHKYHYCLARKILDEWNWHLAHEQQLSLYCSAIILVKKIGELT